MFQLREDAARESTVWGRRLFIFLLLLMLIGYKFGSFIVIPVVESIMAAAPSNITTPVIRNKHSEWGSDEERENK